jgi:drug/metabolite transporter (DMT)-like permease
MFEDRRTSPLDTLPALIAALSWGAMFPIAASALHRVDPFPLTAIRYGVAVPVFLALLVAAEGRRALRTEGRGLELFVLGSVGFAGFNLLSYLGLEHTRPQDAALIVASQPLITVLVLWLTAKRAPAKATLGAMALALLGVALVISRGNPDNLVHGSSGDLMILVGAVGWVFYTLGARRFPGFSPLRYTALTATGGTLTIFLATAVMTAAGGEALPSGADVGAVWLQIVFVIFAGGVIAVIAWNEGIRRLGPANGSLFINLVPVVTFAVAIGQGYRPGGVELTGALLTVVALVGANLAGRQSPSSRTPSSSAPRWWASSWRTVRVTWSRSR